MKSTFRLAERLEALPPYIFSELNVIKASAIKQGISLISLAIGDPDKPTPKAILEKIKEATDQKENHAYSPYEGTLSFRQAVKRWFQGRFGVELDADREILALIGSKEGIAHFPHAFCNPGDKVLVPSPGYPIFSTAITLAGAQPITVALRAENNFLPDLNELESLMARHRPKIFILNYPNNPTSAVCSKGVLTQIVALAKKHHVILVYDNAYSEIYFDRSSRPSSILEIPGAKDIAIEFHSLSKTFNMTGWRLGFAVGHPELVAGLGKVKTNIDSGPLLAVQKAAEFALENAETLADPIRQIYAERRELTLKGLSQLGIEYKAPQATFYVWARVPEQRPSMDFVKSLIQKTGVVLTPGIGFGKEGEYFFRMAMTVDKPQLEKAFTKLEGFLRNT